MSKILAALTAIAPLAKEFFEWRKLRNDPKVRQELEKSKENIKEERLENKLKSYCFEYFIKGNTKVESKIKDVLERLVEV